MLEKSLARVVDGLIREEQSCAVPDRSIQDNLNIHYTLEWFGSNSGQSRVLIYLDQTKAFYRMSYHYMVSALACTVRPMF